MRPKKTILLACPNVKRMRERAFLLKTRGYQVRGAFDYFSVAGELGHPSNSTFDLLLIEGNMDRFWIATLAVWRLRHPEMRVVAVGAINPESPDIDVFLAKDATNPLDLLETIRRLCKRKRGPKGSKTVGCEQRKNPPETVTV